MKKIFHWILLLATTTGFLHSCDDTETYADMKESERKAIEAYIVSEGIKVITLDQFYTQDSTTNVDMNEYVLFKDNGVYMQIIRKGDGNPLADGVRENVVVRYVEVNIKEGDTLTGNWFNASNPDLMTIENTKGSYKGSFTSGYMYTSYGSSVPAGWLVPMPYINLGTNTAKIAKVRLIVPHSQGQSTATSYVYPCFYEITYQKALR